jgi:exopolysaccharide biosynthesis polyprenyl glycosylphosphotransferase|nr:MAG: hypothetical protein KatS3mg041_1529 [Bacteroidota bacterium]
MKPRDPIYQATVVVDLAVVLGAWLLSALFYRPTAIGLGASELMGILLLSGAWMVLLRWWDTYRLGPAAGPLRQEWVRLLGAAFSLISLLGLLGLIGPSWRLSLRQAVAFGAFLSLGSIGARALLRLLAELYYEHLKRHRWRVLIVGTGLPAQWIARTLRERTDWGTEVLGMVRMPFELPVRYEEVYHSEVPYGPSTTLAPVLPRTEVPVLGTLEDLPRLLDQHVVDEVLIGFPLEHYDEVSRLTRLCQELGVPLRIPSRLLQTEEDFTLIAEPIRGWRRTLKRAIDIVGALTGLILLLPFMLGIALLIRLTSPGAPALYVQERVGYHKRIFRLYKFRTMVPGADRMQDALEELNEADGPVFKIRNDPRVTPIGRFLRKHSLDELPQLINVLLGDMSLVGPRPLPLRDYQRFTDPRYKRRFAVKPGLTCLWQISGRSDLRFEEWIRLDLAYIDNWSLGLDFRILLKTIPVVLFGKGAY